ncbi:MAG: D-alanine--D-alanine ligase, partial [Flavobacteriaceae bacterium]|nr:D-alanine--D-alanine ligase [Flavobacteriaceae bacterium]
MSSKKNIAVVMGGYSSEYQISFKSGKVVCENLNKDLYRVFPIHILKEKWVFVDENQKEIALDKSDFSLHLNGQKIQFDAVFNAIHGNPGENGVLLAYFELLGIPHTSDTSYKMALTFNKRDCLSVLTPYDIPHAKSVYINKGDTIDYSKIASAVGLPCFVKANAAGSSFGVTKVYEITDFEKAFENAFQEDHEVLVEEFLDGTEVSVGVITYKGQVKV